MLLLCVVGEFNEGGCFTHSLLPGYDPRTESARQFNVRTHFSKISHKEYKRAYFPFNLKRVVVRDGKNEWL
jgi:hypothetical protein